MENRSENYMFFKNIQQIARQAEMMQNMDPELLDNILQNGHDWADDHISVAKENIDQVFDFFMNKIKEEPLNVPANHGIIQFEKAAVNFNEFIKLNEKKKLEWHDSDAPDAEGKFRDLGINALAEWLIKTRKGDMRKITGSLNQQIAFNKKSDPKYAKKMEKVREKVKSILNKDEK
jgi:hypothetical protein